MSIIRKAPLLTITQKHRVRSLPYQCSLLCAMRYRSIFVRLFFDYFYIVGGEINMLFDAVSSVFSHLKVLYAKHGLSCQL